MTDNTPWNKKGQCNKREKSFKTPAPAKPKRATDTHMTKTKLILSVLIQALTMCVDLPFASDFQLPSMSLCRPHRYF